MSMCTSVCTAKTKGVLQSIDCSRVNALATSLLLSKLCQSCCEPFRRMWDTKNVSDTHPGLHTLLFCLAVQPGNRRNHKIYLCVSGDAQHLWSPLTLLLRSTDTETGEGENRHHPAHGSSGTRLNSWYFLQRKPCFPEVLRYTLFSQDAVFVMAFASGLWTKFSLFPSWIRARK